MDGIKVRLAGTDEGERGEVGIQQPVIHILQGVHRLNDQESQIGQPSVDLVSHPESYSRLESEPMVLERLCKIAQVLRTNLDDSHAQIPGFRKIQCGRIDAEI